MFSIFTHVMKPARDTNSEPGLHVVCYNKGHQKSHETTREI